MRQLGTVPIYRRQDLKDMPIEEQRLKNAESLQNLTNRISEGAFSALFPEGVSHDDPCLRQLKSGAARIFDAAYQAASVKPVIIPVGLHYDHKQRFRSSVLVNIHPPMVLPDELWLIEDSNERAEMMTQEMEKTLTEAIYAMEDWEMHRNFHRAAMLIRAERLSQDGRVGSASIAEKVIGVARLWNGYHQRKEQYPERVQQIIDRVEQYRLDMESLGLLDHQLDGDPRWISRRILVILALQTVLYMLLLPPLLLVGYMINFPTMFLIRYTVRNFVQLEKDRASVQLFSSIALYPTTWVLWSALAYFGHLQATPIFPNLPSVPIASALFVGCVGMISCVVMFVYLRAINRMLRAWKVRWTKRRKQGYIAMLLAERKALSRELIGFSEGLDLPGELGADNKLYWGES